MSIRTNEKSNSRLGRLRDRIRSTLFAEREGSADADDGAGSDEPAASSPAAPGNLFQCATCGTVYIDSEKRVCSECDENVEQVRSELETSIVR